MIDHTRYTITVGHREFVVDGAKDVPHALESIGDALRAQGFTVDFYSRSAVLLRGEFRAMRPMTIEVSSAVTTRRSLFDRIRQFLGA